MPQGASELRRLARLLPDIPRWLEARSILLSGEGDLFGLDESDTLSFVVSSPEQDQICVIGLPERDAIEDAVADAEDRHVVLASPESRTHVARCLPGWRPEPAALHTLTNSGRLPSLEGHDVRLVTRQELEDALLPSELKEELLRACEYSPVAATFAGDRAVSFCYAGSQTETLWDISVDTVEEARRRGYAGVCVAFLVKHMRRLGKEPVWGALESNIASMKLAEKLGFVRVDSLIVFEPGRDIPIIDVESLVNHIEGRTAVAEQIGRACREFGFFYIAGHGISEELQARLEKVSREFFDRDLESKMAIHMAAGGSAWRGYFPVGEELTSGRPDQKEGIYFGAELAEDDAKVSSGLPMHGLNLFPAEVPGFRETVLEYIKEMTELGQKLMAGISLSLGLDESYFLEHYTSDPLVLFRIFNYPSSDDEESWGVAEHTDYGLLTILKQDDAGGLEVKLGSRWIEAPPVPGAFVCNIGDMLDRMTGGRYRSTPHRVRNRSGRNRLSFPFFFDPNFKAEVHPVFNNDAGDDKYDRWDRASVHEFSGTYGEYLLGKIAKVFPGLRPELKDSRGEADC